MITISIPRIAIVTLLLVILVHVYQRFSEPPPRAAIHKHLRTTQKVVMPSLPPTKKAQQSKRFDSNDHDQYGDPQMKSAYFCDLALSLRERCEQIPRDPASLEFCLKATGYYSNSRHCGYRP